ncbi:WD40 repeat-like protein [Lentinus tigrinus ALCF2SS1-7]|uniref:WD40 repeat-like protein n=1 Tax=Lentinus tigrinus ALCF2SS1-7 TaxID=1328758 RepID=UPI001165F01E|nr:WD40 repeat-like protein [Lentinus tigrinus ALCF2SS1-7]
MVLHYQELYKMSNGHVRGITKVVFSPDGTYLASSGLDGHICIWNVESGELGYVDLSLADGHITWMSFSGDTITIAGIFAQSHPVECLAPNDSRLASGAGLRLSIWRWNSSTVRYIKEREVDGPPKNSHNEVKEVIVSSIHWIPSQQCLVATYLNHGIVIYDHSTWLRICTFPLNGLIASASVLDDGTLIAVLNVDHGFDVYSLASGDPVCTVEHTIRQKVPTPAIWIHGGFALLGGTTSGWLTVWDIVGFLERQKHDIDDSALVRVL